MNIFNLEGEEIMLARDNDNFRTLGEDWTHDPPNTTRLSDVPATEPEGRKFDSCLGMEISFVPGQHGFSSFQVENVHWKCICAASVSLKLIKIKIKLIYATTSS